MKNTIAVVFCAVLLHLVSCNKVADAVISRAIAPNPGYTDYFIQKGQQFSDHSGYVPVETDLMSFTAKFDSSAIYTSMVAENQYDINKLYGFSDNNADHHQFSARFGWRWSEGALRLFAYVYNNGITDSKELQTVEIGKEISCSIQVKAGQYVFSVNGTSWTMPRESTTPKAKGYQLYPYFGGDELAPHDIHIFIRPS